jgi:hypothetical protein
VNRRHPRFAHHPLPFPPNPAPNNRSTAGFRLKEAVTEIAFL